MKTLKLKLMLFVGITLSSFAAHAGLVTNVELIDANQVSISMSGTIDGPTPGGSTYLFILLNPVSDPTTCGSNVCSASYVSGNLQEGAGNPPSAQWVANYIGGPHIQFNWGGHLNIGDVMSGTSTYSIATGHGLTSAHLQGAGVYWGYGPEIQNGTYQGAVSSAVPAPGMLLLMGLALAMLGITRKK